MGIGLVGMDFQESVFPDLGSLGGITAKESKGQDIPLMRKLHRVPRLITHIRFKTFTAMLFEQAKKT